MTPKVSHIDPAPFNWPGLPELWPINVALEWLRLQLAPRFDGWDSHLQCPIDGELRWVTEELHEDYYRRVEEAGGREALLAIIREAGGEAALSKKLDEAIVRPDERVGGGDVLQAIVSRLEGDDALWDSLEEDCRDRVISIAGEETIRSILDRAGSVKTFWKELAKYPDAVWWESPLRMWIGRTPEAFDHAIASAGADGDDATREALEALKVVSPRPEDVVSPRHDQTEEAQTVARVVSSPPEDVLSPVYATAEQEAELNRWTRLKEGLPELLARHFDTLSPYWQSRREVGGVSDPLRINIPPTPMHQSDWTDMTGLGGLRKAFEFPGPAVEGEVALEGHLYRIFFTVAGTRALATMLWPGDVAEPDTNKALRTRPQTHWDVVDELLAENPSASWKEAIEFLESKGLRTELKDGKVKIFRGEELIGEPTEKSFQQTLTRRRKKFR